MSTRNSALKWGYNAVKRGSESTIAAFQDQFTGENYRRLRNITIYAGAIFAALG